MSVWSCGRYAARPERGFAVIGVFGLDSIRHHLPRQRFRPARNDTHNDGFGVARKSKIQGIIAASTARLPRRECKRIANAGS